MREITVHAGPILDSEEECFVIGVRCDGYADTPFVKEVFDRYEPVKRFLQRWVNRGGVAPGSYIGIPGIHPEGVQVRPTVYCAVVLNETADIPKLEAVHDALKGCFSECMALGFQKVALHLPSLMRETTNAEDHLKLSVKEITDFHYTLPIYMS